MTLVGASVDGAANAVFQQETGCFNTKTFEYSGTNAGKMAAAYCAGWGTTAISACQCVCSDQNLCYEYTLVSGNDCGIILTTYTSNLAASTAFCSILCILVFAYSVFTCCTLCGAQGAASHFTYNPAASATPGGGPLAQTVINDEGVEDHAL